MKNLLSVASVIMILFCLVFSGCSNTSGSSDVNSDKDRESDIIVDETEVFSEHIDDDDIAVNINPVATLELSDGKKIVIELCYDAAPNTVASFIAYVKADAFVDFGFTEVRNKKLVMTGSLSGEYSAPFYTPDEYENNPLSHVRGTVTMTRTAVSDTCLGSFSILTADYQALDKSFTAFGKVIEGMECVDKLAALEINAEDNHIKNPVEITKITVNTFGQIIPAPVIIEKK